MTLTLAIYGLRAKFQCSASTTEAPRESYSKLEKKLLDIHCLVRKT